MAVVFPAKPPHVDATNDHTVAESMEVMTRGMWDAEREQFQEDCQDLAALMWHKNTPKDGMPVKKPGDMSQAERFKPLDGMTVAKIRFNLKAERREQIKTTAK
jgi:hypothetical protein